MKITRNQVTGIWGVLSSRVLLPPWRPQRLLGNRVHGAGCTCRCRCDDIPQDLHITAFKARALASEKLLFNNYSTSKPEICFAVHSGY